MPLLFNKRVVYIILLSVLVLGVQTIRIQRPFLGHYASYQATVMASISNNMIQENFSELLLPKTNLLISGKKSLHLNQYPFPSLIAALGKKVFGGTLEFWGRFQSIIFNYFSIILIFLIGKKLFNPQTGLIASAIFGLSPYTLIYGQSFMSESISLFFLLLSFFLLLPHSNKQHSFSRIVLSAFCLSISLTGRLHFILFFPLFFYLLIRKGEKKIFNAFIFIFVALAMPVFWYLYTYFAAFHFENVHTNMFLQITAERKISLLVSLNFWRHLFDLFSQLMLTPLAFPFAILALFVSKKTESFWLISASILFGLMTVILAPDKIIAHDFYLYGIFPFLSLLAASGFEEMTRSFPKLKSPFMVTIFTLLFFAVSSRYFFHPIFYYPELKNLTAFQQTIEKTTRQDDQFIVFGNDPGGIFYYVNRPSYPLQPDRIGQPLQAYLKNSKFKKLNLEEVNQLEEAMKDPVTWFEYLKKQGASYFFSANKIELEHFPPLLSQLLSNYQLVSNQTDDFYLFKISGDQ